MKIKMTVSLAGADFALQPGEMTERFPEAEALRLVSVGHAELVTDAPIEQAVKKPTREKRG